MPVAWQLKLLPHLDKAFYRPLRGKQVHGPGRDNPAGINLQAVSHLYLARGQRRYDPEAQGLAYPYDPLFRRYPTGYRGCMHRHHPGCLVLAYLYMRYKVAVLQRPGQIDFRVIEKLSRRNLFEQHAGFGMVHPLGCRRHIQQ